MGYINISVVEGKLGSGKTRYLLDKVVDTAMKDKFRNIIFVSDGQTSLEVMSYITSRLVYPFPLTLVMAYTLNEIRPVVGACDLIESKAIEGDVMVVLDLHDSKLTNYILDFIAGSSRSRRIKTTVSRQLANDSTHVGVSEFSTSYGTRR